MGRRRVMAGHEDELISTTVENKRDTTFNLILVGVMIVVLIMSGVVLVDALVLRGQTASVPSVQRVLVSPPVAPIKRGEQREVRPRGTSDILLCSTEGRGCKRAIVAMLNQDRALYGVSPIALSLSMSNGIKGGCIGALGHARHLEQVVIDFSLFGQYAHDQFPADVCGTYRGASENAGVAQGFPKWDAFLQIDQGMMGEPYEEGCTYDHKCNILSRSMDRVGVAVVKRSDGTVFVVEDFSG
jgi:hypothetical protein